MEVTINHGSIAGSTLAYSVIAITPSAPWSQDVNITAVASSSVVTLTPAAFVAARNTSVYTLNVYGSAVVAPTVTNVTVASGAGAPGDAAFNQTLQVIVYRNPYTPRP